MAGIPGPRGLPRAAVLALNLLLFALPCSAGAQESTGGMFATETARPDTVTCRSACTGLDAAGEGSVVRVSGEAMAAVAQVIFLGGPGGADDVGAPAQNAVPGSVEAAVPAGAASGPVAVVNGDGNRSGRSRATLRIDVPERTQAGPLEARVDARRVFFDGRRQAALSYFVRGGEPVTLSIELVRAVDGTFIARWSPGVVQPGTVQSVEWNGLAGGRVQKEGRYEFRVTVGPAGARAAQSGGAGTTTAVQRFTFLRNQFPVRGPHEMGTDAGRFGAAREGHVHQGQDVFAACGTPLVAARGGTVKFTGVQSRAGNYLVIDGHATGLDYAYMHLRDPALVARGDAVYTGQLIGYVGDTGDADGCHLHFELWSAPGWYTGGSPLDPLPDLTAWDRQS